MKLYKCLKHAFNMVVHSRLRSWLTIIGIVIGVASVISIVAMGEGMERSMIDQLGDFGSDILTISPGAAKAYFGMGRSGGGAASADQDPLTRKDVQVLKGIAEIELIDTRISGSAEVYYLGEKGSITITGVDQKVWSDIITDEIDSGRLLDSADMNVIVIGNSLANDYFDDTIGINKMVQIEGSAFRVVGILEEGSGTSLYMPIKAAYQVLDDKTVDEYDSIVIRVDEDKDLEELTAKIDKKLMLSRHVTEKDKDFSISSNVQVQEARTEMISTLSMFLTALAAISLLVGAVGVANTMFTSVLEKTKEIGIMKAIGARNNDILFIFLFNSGIIGLIGGIVGAIFGYGISQIVGIAMGMPTIVSFSIVMIALGVSVAVGMIAGLIPAYQASLLSPVDALRYE